MSAWEDIGKSDEWYTPKYIFDSLGVEFDQDVAAPEQRVYVHVPAKEFITKTSLEKAWNGFVWCNPPFGKRNGITPWLNRMYEHGNGIALAPDRTSATWWQEAAKKADCVLFVHGKIKFIKPDGSIGKQPGTGTTLFGYGAFAIQALQRAENNSLGILCAFNYSWMRDQQNIMRQQMKAMKHTLNLYAENE